MTKHAKRSGWSARMQVDWVDQVHGPTVVPGQQGVGARQGQGKAPGRGGGYLHECTTPQVWEEAKIRELADMGLPSVWLAVVREIGYDRFMAMWRILDAAVEIRSDSDSMIEVKLRRYSSFQRYQRNRFIESLAPFMDNRQIRDRVKAVLGEKLTVHHVGRLAKRRRLPIE